MNEIQRIYADYLDEYAIQQLRVKYLASSSRERISLLKKLQRTRWALPNEIARLAVEDSDSRVRAWYAKYGLFRGDDEFCDRLRADQDPVVRASLVEGDHFLDTFRWESASELERLAYLRRFYIPEDFVLKLFDSENNELGLSREERRRYAVTFLVARAEPEKIEEFSRQKREQEYVDNWPLFVADLGGGTGGELIELMPKWPKDAGVQDFVYRFCAPCGHTDVVYEHCDEPRWRRCLLENMLRKEEWMLGTCAARVLELARKDPDDKCRELAHMDPFIGRAWIGRKRSQAVLEEAMRSRDVAALRGLAQNKALKPAQLIEVGRVLGKLNSNEASVAAYQVQKTLEAKHAEPLQAPETEQAEDMELTSGKERWLSELGRLQRRLDGLSSSLEVVVNILGFSVFYVWLGAIIGISAGAAVYLLSNNLGWAVFACGIGVLAGLSFAVLVCFQFKLYSTLWYTHPFVWPRGLRVYSGEQNSRSEQPRRHSKEELEEWEQMLTVFGQASGGREEQREEAEVDIDHERQRIERYKSALAKAKAHEESGRGAEHGKEHDSIASRIGQILGRLLKVGGNSP
jgi:hypothetical protein